MGLAVFAATSTVMCFFSVFLTENRKILCLCNSVAQGDRLELVAHTIQALPVVIVIETPDLTEVYVIDARASLFINTDKSF